MYHVRVYFASQYKDGSETRQAAKQNGDYFFLVRTARMVSGVELRTADGAGKW